MPQPRKYSSVAERQRAYRQRSQQVIASQLAAKGLPTQPSLATFPGRRRWSAALLQAQHLLQTVAQEMTDYYEERSEEWREGDNADRLQDQMEQLEGLLDTLTDLCEQVTIPSIPRREPTPPRTSSGLGSPS